MRGTYAQAQAYCQKEETRDPERPFVSFGEQPAAGIGAQGSRTDFEVIKDRFKEGDSLLSIAEDFPGHLVRYSKGLDRLQALYHKPRREKTLVYWYYGATGTGKSRLAFACYPDAYVKMGANKWWDGYESNHCTVIDDYRTGLCPFNELLRLFDRYSHRVEAKGCSMQFNSTVLIVTAPKSPADMWIGRELEDMRQLTRRIDYIRNFTLHPWDAIDEATLIPDRHFDVVEGEEKIDEPVLLLPPVSLF
jgi:hypothetical protein